MKEERTGRDCNPKTRNMYICEATTFVYICIMRITSTSFNKMPLSFLLSVFFIPRHAKLHSLFSAFPLSSRFKLFFSLASSVELFFAFTYACTRVNGKRGRVFWCTRGSRVFVYRPSGDAKRFAKRKKNNDDGNNYGVTTIFTRELTHFPHMISSRKS